MRKYRDQCFLTVLVVITLLSSTSIFAKSILNIVPAALTLGVGKTATASMQYTVTNNTKHPINQLTIDPTYQTNANSAGISVAANMCSSVTLSPNTSCTFNVLINGVGQPYKFELRPRVCGYNGAVCSVPLAVNALQVTVAPGPTVVATTPSGDVAAANYNSLVLTFSETMDATTVSNSSVSLVQSGVNTNILGACVPSSGNTVFTCAFNTTLVGNQLYIITVSNAVKSGDGVPLATSYTANFTTSPRFAYVASYSGQYVSVCPITDPTTGILSNTCTLQSFSGASGVTVNPAGTILYITNANNCPNSTVTSCNIDNTYGTLSNCHTVNDASFCYPTAVSINGNHAYVNNYGNNTVSNCAIQSDGSLTACSVVSTLPLIAGHGYGYDGIALNNSGTLLYITQAQGNTTPKNILTCPVQDGVVASGIDGINCVSYTDPSFSATAGIALNSLGSTVYVTSSSGGMGTVSACAVNPNGSLGICTFLDIPIFTSLKFGKVALNAANSYIYVANQINNYVVLCQLNPDGTFKGSNFCGEQLPTGLNGPQGIALL